MPGRVLSEPEVQPAEMPARGAPARRVPASGVSAPASVLRLCGRETQITDSKIGTMRGDRTRKAIRVPMAFPLQGM